MRQTKNPYLPGWEFVPDGEPKLFGDRVYIYGSHDEAQGTTYCTGDYVCWSAPADDLSSWTFEGVIYRRTDDPTYTEPILYFAPDAVQGPDGRYYLFYFSSKMDKIAVAVCEEPAGHFTYYGDIHFSNGSRLTAQSGYGLPFDPGIYCGPEGNFLYYGFAMQRYSKHIPDEGYRGGFAVQLADDLLTIKSEPVLTIPGKLHADGTMFEGHAFLEASSIRRYNNLFYLVYSSELGHELCYSVSDSPMGPFSYGGTIISNGDIGLNGRSEDDAVYYLGNNHGGLLQIEDQFYIFYHRHTYGAEYSRQGCIEKVSILPDGNIPQVEITSIGASGKPWKAAGEYSAHLCCYLRSREGIQHYSSSVKWKEPHPYIALEGREQVSTLQNSYIHNLQDGAVCGFKYLDFYGNEAEIAIECRGNFNGSVSVFTAESGTCPVADIKVTESDSWKYFTGTLDHMNGTTGLYFLFKGTGVCDLNCFRITEKQL